MLASESNTMRVGCLGTASTREVRSGSSATAVWIPTATASTSARQRCARARLASFEIHFESPAAVATFPSSVVATLKTTCGRPVSACLRKGWLRRRACAATSPFTTSTSTPSSRRIPRPRPFALAVGSSLATTTRAIFAARIASVQGGVLPSCAHGSSDTYMRGPSRVLLARVERRPLRVGQSRLLVEALADRPAVLDDHGADQGIGTRPPTRPRSQLEGPQEVLLVVLDHKVDSRVNLPPATFRAPW